MNPETPDIPLDGMTVHPDWNHIETLTIHPDCDTLIVVPGRALFKSGVDAMSFDFNPTRAATWSLNEYQDRSELEYILLQIQLGVVKCASILHSIVVFSGGCTRVEGEGWTEGESYYLTAEYFNWWQDKTEVPTYLMKAKVFVERYAADLFENLFMSVKLFQMVHPQKEVPKKVIVIGYSFEEKRLRLHAKSLGIPEFEFISMEDPANFSNDPLALQREAQNIACYTEDPFGENLDSVVGKKKLKRKMFSHDYPYGSVRDVVESYKKQFQRRKAS